MDRLRYAHTRSSSRTSVPITTPTAMATVGVECWPPSGDFSPDVPIPGGPLGSSGEPVPWPPLLPPVVPPCEALPEWPGREPETVSDGSEKPIEVGEAPSPLSGPPSALATGSPDEETWLNDLLGSDTSLADTGVGLPSVPITVVVGTALSDSPGGTLPLCPLSGGSSVDPPSDGVGLPSPPPLGVLTSPPPLSGLPPPL